MPNENQSDRGLHSLSAGTEDETQDKRGLQSEHIAGPMGDIVPLAEPPEKKCGFRLEDEYGYRVCLKSFGHEPPHFERERPVGPLLIPPRPPGHSQ